MVPAAEQQARGMLLQQATLTQGMLIELLHLIACKQVGDLRARYLSQYAGKLLQLHVQHHIKGSTAE